MAEPNVTMIVITADLQCDKCYKKIKKVLCKLPQIRDQVYDEKQNTVTIKVVSCKPEKIMRKIRCKGGECVTNIQIKPPPKPPAKPDKGTKSDKDTDQKSKDKDPKPALCYPPLVAGFPIPVAAFPIGGCCRGSCGGFCRGSCRGSRGCCRGFCGCYCGTPVYEDPYACSIM